MDASQTNVTLRSLVQTARQRLQAHYPAPEAGALADAMCRHLFGYSRTEVVLYGDRTVPDTAGWDRMLEELLRDRPLAYITGETEFCGLRLQVGPDVLIPRPETEELVDWILKDNPEGPEPQGLLDIGTGSGCIAVAVAVQRPAWRVCACDVMPGALETARRNAGALHAGVTCLHYDILSDASFPSADSPFDIIVSNPPYVTEAQKAEMQPNVLLYEPRTALFVPDEDPAVFYRHIARFGRSHLKPGGRVYVEINETLPDLTRQVFLDNGFSDVRLRRDINGKWRMLRAGL